MIEGGKSGTPAAAIGALAEMRRQQGAVVGGSGTRPDGFGFAALRNRKF